MVTWKEIDEECYEADKDYRQRLVAIYRKYEGRETDEVVRGKPVLVTQRSFAKRRGINAQTFNLWVNAGGRPNAGHPDSDRKTEKCELHQTPKQRLEFAIGQLERVLEAIRGLNDWAEQRITETIYELRADLEKKEKVK